MRQPSRREREQRFRTDLVLEAAEGAFGAHGFQGASMEDIAKRAELSVGSLYNLFPGKEALFAGVIERRQEEFLAGAQAAIDAESAALGKLERLVAFAFAYFERNEHIFQLYLSATSGFLWNIRRTLGEGAFQRQLRFVELVGAICRQGIAREGWPRTDEVTLAWALIALLNAFITRWVTTDPREPLPARVREAQLMIRRLVGAGPHFSTRERRRRIDR
ncbi:MAG TPA: TetR/AcrR family transcriptional regulator [Candidatus Limnocylindria bacterium]|nr:TetR/AcrR family transcriptional regulator [Candidatus Limnocylindria bacterium]